MIKIEVENLEKVTGKMLSANRRLRSKLIDTIRGLTIEAEGRVKVKLSGEVLHVRTGVLRNSITSRVTMAENAIVGSVGTAVNYGKVHEYGFQGVVTVGQHLRRTKAQMKKASYSIVNKAGERIVKIRQTGKLGKRTGSTIVSQHTRQANFPERSFLRSTLAEMADQIRAEIRLAVRSEL